MSLGIDVNILLYALDAGCTEHPKASAFMQRCAGDGEVFCLAWVTLMSDNFWQQYQRVAAEVPVRGNLVPDAHLAALLRQHGVGKIYTRDKDFRKFAGLTVRDPLL